jgi:anti-sigma factor RsiW
MDEDLIRRLDAERGAPGGTLPQLDPAEAETAAAWARQDRALARLYAPIAAEGVPDRFAAIIGRAAASEPGRHGIPSPAQVTTATPANQTFPPRRAAAAAAILALGIVLGFGAARIGTPQAVATGTTLADAALLAHSTYAPEVRHPVEVAASDSDHMTAWLSKRLGRGLVIPDFGAEGFHLVGGRVLPDMNGPAAAMMYEDATGARVTVYISNDPGQSETALRLASGHGSEGFWWVDHGLGCAVVGDAPRDVLKTMAGKAYQAIAG